MAPRKKGKKGTTGKKKNVISQEYIACYVNSVKIKFQTLKRQMEAFKNDRINMMKEYRDCVKIQIPSDMEGLTLRELSEREEEEKRKEEATKERGRRGIKTRFQVALSPPEPTKRSKTDTLKGTDQKKPYWTRGHHVNVEGNVKRVKITRNGNTSGAKSSGYSSASTQSLEEPPLKGGRYNTNSKYRKVIPTSSRYKIPESSSSSEDMSFGIRTCKNVMTSTPATRTAPKRDSPKSKRKVASKVDSGRVLRSRQKETNKSFIKPNEKPSSRAPPSFHKNESTSSRDNRRLVGCSITRFAQCQRKATPVQAQSNSSVVSTIDQRSVYNEEDNIPLSVLMQSSVNNTSLINENLTIIRDVCSVVKEDGISSINMECTSQEKYLTDGSGNSIISVEDSFIVSKEGKTVSIHTSVLSVSRDCGVPQSSNLSSPNTGKTKCKTGQENANVISESIDFQYAHCGGPVVLDVEEDKAITNDETSFVRPKNVAGPDTGLALLRLPREGELGVSAAGSPLLTAATATGDVARVLVPLRNGDVVALQPMSPSNCAPLDSAFAEEVKSTIRRQLKELSNVLRGALQGSGESEPPTPSTPIMRPLGSMASWSKTKFHMNITATSANLEGHPLRRRSSVWRRLFTTQEPGSNQVSCLNDFASGRAASSNAYEDARHTKNASHSGGLTDIVKSEMAAGNITLTPSRSSKPVEIDLSPYQSDMLQSIKQTEKKASTYKALSDETLKNKQFIGTGVGNQIDTKDEMSNLLLTPKRVQFHLPDLRKEVPSQRPESEVRQKGCNLSDSNIRGKSTTVRHLGKSKVRENCKKENKRPGSPKNKVKKKITTSKENKTDKSISDANMSTNKPSRTRVDELKRRLQLR